MKMRSSSMNFRRFINITAAAALCAAACYGLAPGEKQGVPEDEIWLIVRGDDIGFAHGANMGFEQVFTNGIISAAEIMVPPSWFNEGVRIMKEHRGIEAGVHITLNSEWMEYRWRPVAMHRPGTKLVDSDGYLYHRTDSNAEMAKLYGSDYSFLGANIDLADIETEIRAQIERAVEKLPRINHLSCHMETAMASSELKKLTGNLAREYGLIPCWEISEAARSISLWSVPVEDKTDSLAACLQKMEPGNLYYLVLHPGVDTPEMQAINSPAYDADKYMSKHRAAVTAALVSEQVQEIIKKRNIRIVTHKDVMEAGLMGDSSI